jgi:diguanylate cyclase (GGDEF)-like protein
MAARARTAFLFPAFLLFIALSILLFKAPDQAATISALFFVFVFMTAAFQTVETASFFAVLVAMVEFTGAGMVLTGWDRAFLAAQAPFMGLSLWLIHLSAVRELRMENESANFLQERQEKLAHRHKEKEAMTKRVADLMEQAALRRHLFDAVQQLASLLDPVVIRQRLMEFVRASVKKGTIQFFAGHVPRDPLDKWVMDRKISLLVTDTAQDARFKMARLPNEVRSALAAPMVVERQWVGLVRVNGFEPDLFTVGDLRVLEALTLMASLALENLQLLHRLKEGAVRDNLTALYTHRFFEERLNEEILSAGRFQTEFCVLLLDIDHFKRYNDTYGHAAGDEVLVRFSKLLQGMVRPVDIVARYGGEEFTVIMPQTGIDQARATAEQIRLAIQAESFQFGAERLAQERVMVSIGISDFPHEATTASQLIRVADMRLYHAKQNGRNQVVG